ncbi:MAG: PBP1A family penicillin-binding protein [Gemmatimonadota bacterium]|nr:PBP1A family penicillin-binding protein [Gemmatimonadota bacterium]
MRHGSQRTGRRVFGRGGWLGAGHRETAALAIVLAGLVLFDAWLGSCGFAGCPSPAEVRAYRPDEGGRILDRSGRLIGRLSFVNRIDVPLARVPQHVRDAFVATEDRRFYAHHGVDWHGFFRAAARDAAALGVREGFSTIDMQVARNTFLAGRYDGRSLRRKLLEMRYARLLERDLSKNRILDLYVNAIYLGDGVYGVEAASRDLFGKHVWQLSLAEGALLAALPKGPSAYSPRHDEARARARRDLVLGLMADQGYVSRQRAAAAQDTPIELADRGWRADQRDASTVVDAVRAVVDSVLPAGRRSGDLTVRTTVDWTLQRAADRVIPAQAGAIERETDAAYGGAPGPAEGAFVALDAASGDIRALVGGTDVVRGGFDRALDARRQPGSAFKPFVYTAALRAGVSPASMVEDEPVDVPLGGNRMWRPANYGGEYTGPITVRRALMISSNAAAVRLSHGVGERQVIAAARDNGITSRLAPVPAIALGAFEVTPLELVSAYAPFANGGRRVTPRLVASIEGPGGRVLWRSAVETAPAMDPRNAYEMTSMLEGVVDYGTGRVVRDMGITGPVAGKTGTTNDNADVWFVGFTPTLVAGVWFGYDTPRAISPSATGGRLAAPAWAAIVRAGWREPDSSRWVPPAGMVPAVIDPESGQLAGPWCPHRDTVWFRPGSAPTDTCTMHTEPPAPSFADGFGDWVRALVARGLRHLIRF